MDKKFLSDEKKRIVKDLYLKAESLAKERYDQESAREESLITQAARLQTAVSIFSTGIFALLPTIIHSDYRGSLNLTFIYIYISIISFFLILSLFFSTFAQGRWNRKMEIKPNDIIDKILGENEQTYLNDPFLLNYHLVKNYVEACASISSNNQKRVCYIQVSTWSFYLSIVGCFFFWVHATMILYIS